MNKKCSWCLQVKPVSEFYVKENRPSNPCKVCKRASVNSGTKRDDHYTRGDPDPLRPKCCGVMVKRNKLRTKTYSTQYYKCKSCGRIEGVKCDEVMDAADIVLGEIEMPVLQTNVKWEEHELKIPAQQEADHWLYKWWEGMSNGRNLSPESVQNSYEQNIPISTQTSSILSRIFQTANLSS